MVYYDPHIAGQHNPLYNLNHQVFFRGSHEGHLGHDRIVVVPVSKGLVAYNCDEQKPPNSTIFGRCTNIKLYGKTRMILNNVTKSQGVNGATQKIWSMESMHCMTWATVLDFLNMKVYSVKETTNQH